MNGTLHTRQFTCSDADLAQAAALLRAGGVVAMPTETVYGLAADARNAAGVERIFAAKQRPHWDPLIVHVSDETMLQEVVADISDTARRLMDAFWPGPLTLLLPRRPELPLAVTAGRELVGVRMPAHSVALALIRAAHAPLAAPSANRFGHVSPTSAAHVLADLDGRIDAVVDGGACAIGVESTVIEPRTDGVILYRAGGISGRTIEGAAGIPLQVYKPASHAAGRPESLPSPGVGIRHYATRARLQVVASESELHETLTREPSRSTAVLLPANWRLASHPGPVRCWADIDDAAALASSLYDGLRTLDTDGVTLILVPLPSRTDGLFAALHDRLEKAARII